MRPKLMLDKINEIEKLSDQKELFLGIHCWPIFRNAVLLSATHKAFRKISKISIIKLIFAFSSLANAVIFKKPCHSLFLTDSKFLKYHDGVWRFGDSSVIAEAINRLGKGTYIFTQDLGDERQSVESLATVYPITSLSSFLAGMCARFSKYNRLGKYCQTNFELLSQNGVTLTKLPSKFQLEKNIWFVVIASFLLGLILKRLKPKCCYVKCYYSLIGMALCVACNRLGIEIVDLQHGVSGRNMRAYGRWENVPSGGYNTMPNTFYCWTDEDATAINEWMLGEGFQKRALHVGNIWLDYVADLSNGAKVEESPWDYKISDIVNTFKRVTVVTTSSEKIPLLITDYIHDNPEDLFLIRLHPNVDHNVLNEWYADIQKNGNNVVVEASTKCSIRHLMQCSDIHITEWSASVYDAYFEGVPTIILSPVGKDYFEKFIEKGFVTVVYTREELNKWAPIVKKFSCINKAENSWQKRL
jgi:hypothetical protein